VTPVIYTDYPSGYEIVLLSASGIPTGVAYDPRRAAMPVPWHRDCHHCTAGRQKEITIQVKRAIQLLRTVSPSGSRTSYTVPTNSHPHHVTYWTENGVRKAVVSSEPLADREDVPTLEISAEQDSEMSYDGNLRDFQSPILHRCLQLIFSQRAASVQEVLAATRPLVEQQEKHGIPARLQNKCSKIDWIALTSDLRRSP